MILIFFYLFFISNTKVQCITDGKVLDDTTGYYWQAAVQDKADQWKVICVAAVITKSKLITSANCTYHRDHKTLQIRTESYKKTVYAGKHYDDLFIREHGGFDPVTLENNIAVIILRNQRFRFNNRLGKVILPKDQNLPKGEVTVVAWCNHQSKSSFKTDQAFVTATPKIVDLGTCNRKFDGVSDVQLTDENICSDYLGTGCRGLCIEDAGAPLVQMSKNKQPELHGILSFGYFCEYKPTVYTRVYPYIDWIKSEFVFNSFSYSH